MMTSAVAIASSNTYVNVPTFETLLPSIERIAQFAFRKLPRSCRDDMVAEAIANAFIGFLSLVKRGLTTLIYPTALARYAIRRVWEGRRVGSRRNARDVLSEFAQAKQRFVVEQLDNQNADHRWQEQLLVDRHASPAELAASRLDFRDWLARLDSRRRQLALTLAHGDTTCEAAARFGLSAARISQYRRQLEANWDQFQASPCVL